ncbi:hypothetical protein [Hymenobacter nivis]|uniref:Uncharacterized protein n=1 Tax=Hymenobacter nivis TaxID=1850093 RepID=A0A502HBU5_9BACT|nr:hypothetical protein [Hymenobacter nivis]TPG71981.1 hypothetical protein EAH73_01680 [Hymenobacter nivis]
MAKTPKNDPIGFGRKAMPDEVGNEQASEQPAHEPEPPLVEPIFVDDVVMYEILARYNLLPLAAVSRFEYQLVQVIAALEKRVRELDPDL